MPNIPPPSGLYRQDVTPSSQSQQRGISAFQQQQQRSQQYQGHQNRIYYGGGGGGNYQQHQQQQQQQQYKRSYSDYNADQNSQHTPPQHQQQHSGQFYQKKQKTDFHHPQQQHFGSQYRDHHHHHQNDNYSSSSSQYSRQNSNGFSLGASSTNLPFPTIIPTGMSIEALNALLIRIRLHELNEQGAQLHNGFSSLDRQEKQKLYREIQKLVSLARQINPLFNYENHFSLIKQFVTESEISMADMGEQESSEQTKEISRKIYIPVDEYPDYNFIGLIIGPGGLTQKKLEKESGAKIAVRGKGSVKPGKIPAKSFGDEENLHVLITAEDEDSVEKAAEMIKRLLIPVEEGTNELKKEQLRELARQRGFTIEGMSDAELGAAVEDGGGESADFIAKLQSYGLNQHMPDQPPIPGVTSHVEIPGVTDNKKYTSGGKSGIESALDKLKRELLMEADEMGKALTEEQKMEDEKAVVEPPKIQAPSANPFEDSYEKTYDLYYEYYKQYFLQQQRTYQQFLDLFRGYGGEIPSKEHASYFQTVVWAISDQLPPVPGSLVIQKQQP
ncbi:hypothetical protein FDP41_004717 [Naegleria fowleri]|uniref:Branchpoint-bridging protein n=1 Tax=Naegleria fowleri TaxID=5763 RepID=A0A6A5BP47_NAEFO|nr:uncharacterized protein FDP41_004717 [Naegleria fowleri]KAF0976041.1 hypothetical protein FDP41_004717 [Naegleria fowleri]CAG4715501.1 unnamed protein product [Naegleria fowleri]